MQALSFDDISLVPQYSDLDSRDEVSFRTSLNGDIILGLPILSAPMDTVTSIEMQDALRAEGGLGIHHRYCDEFQLVRGSHYGGIAVSPSMGTGFIDRLMQNNQNPVVVIDVAHGHSRKALDYAAYCAASGCVVVSGNICTPEAAEEYLNIGVKLLRVGVGSGAARTTRHTAGVGVPQVTAIQSIYEVFEEDATIISDGGINYSGDIVKALAVGAKAVMIGRLFAGCPEAPGSHNVIDNVRVKRYRGMASAEALAEAGKERNLEGIPAWIPVTASVKNIIEDLKIGMRAGFAYLGARNIQELQERCEYVALTYQGFVESRPRI